MDVTVVVATYGTQDWIELANERAIPSAEAQGVPVVHAHTNTGTLSDARNLGLSKVETEFVAHLDADDELAAGYFDAMAAGAADVRAPAVQYTYGRRWERAKMPRVWGHDHLCVGECLEFGNWLVIGSVARTELVRRVGGHVEYEWSEDWSLWLRCHLAGATIEALPAAVYRAHIRFDSRNRSATPEMKAAVHEQIARDCGLVVAT